MIWKMYISTGHIIHIHVLISLVFCFTSSNVHDWLLCVLLSVITINKVLSKCGFIILWTILECTYLEMRQKKIDVISLEMFLYEQLILNFIFYFAAKKSLFFLEQILKYKKKIDKGWVQNISIWEMKHTKNKEKRNRNFKNPW